MSTHTDMRPLCRIVAAGTDKTGVLKNVNVTASQVLDARLHLKEYVQLTAAQYAADNNKAIPTLQVTASNVPGLPTIYVNGYTGPS